MRLYLVQHGLAMNKEEDPDRPLNEQGWAGTKKTATLISAVGNVKPTKIIHSGKTRAKQTAEMIGEHLELSGKVEQVDGMAPLDEPTIWAEKINDMKDDIMLVGHLPHLAKLTAHLLTKNENKTIVEFQNSGIACLERDEENVWVLKWMMVPEVLP